MSLLTFSSPWLYTAAFVGGAAISAVPNSPTAPGPAPRVVCQADPRMVSNPAPTQQRSAASAGEVPEHILEAAQREVHDGRVVSAYLDPSITSSQVYRVVLDASEWDRRLTIRDDGVVLLKQRLHKPEDPQVAWR
jgi:hypothetical protein